jgi:hypothetical protein
VSSRVTRGLTVAAVVITYLRPDILRSTLAVWRDSDRIPDQFLVVDASPDALSQRAKVLREFSDLFRGRGSDYLVSAEPSTTGQRNQALDTTWADVVLFLDDESRPERTYVDRILEVYESDKEELIGGVGGSERDEESLPARMRAAIKNSGRLVARSVPMSRRQAFPSVVRSPKRVRGVPLRRVRQLFGCRMSFRTRLVLAQRFDERLLRYGLCEDLDLSIRVSRTHALVQRTDAFVRHDEAGVVGRVSTNARFLIGWANPTYVTEKHFPADWNRRPLDRLLALSRARAALPYLFRRDDAGRRAVIERFDVAAAMISFIRDGESGALGERFSALQRYIFQADTQEVLARLEPYLSWEGDVWQHLPSGHSR